MNKAKKYYHSVDLLRGVTALLVATYHFINHEDGNGFLYPTDSLMRTGSSVLPGVVFVFFLLSGFVISMTMYKQKYRIAKLGHFLARRWVRIEVPYLCSIFVFLFIGYLWAVKGGYPFEVDFNRFIHHLTYTVSFFDYSWYNDVYWTLALEFQFYILIAILFPLLVSKNVIIRYVTIISLSLAGLMISDNQLIFRYITMFLVGMLMFFWLHSEKKNNFALLLMALGLIQIGFMFDTITALYLLASLVIINIQVSEKNLLSRFGKQAYSFYLLHGVFGGSLIYFLAPKVEGEIAKLLVFVSAILVSIALSYVFFRLIEKPSMSLSRRITFSKKNKLK